MAEAFPPSLRDALSLDQAQAVDRLCDLFEQMLLTGSSPCIEAFLNQLAETARPHLLRELLEIESEHQRKAGVEVDVREYRVRFPDYLQVVDAVVGPLDSSSRQQLLQEFETAWRAGTQPSLESFLDRVAETYKPQVLFQLLKIELWWDENPIRKGYIRRFSSYTDVVNKAFDLFHSEIDGACELTAAAPVPAGSLEETKAEWRPEQALDTPARGSTTQLPAAAPEPSPKSAGARLFGQYELLEEIARGGMGVVYRARDLRLGRIVALKMLLAGSLAGKSEIARFQAEARAAATLSHPAIVPVFDIGEFDTQHYFTMELVDGQSLQSKIHGGPIATRECVRICKQIAEAVGHAHRHGIIHRDLKPANVLLESSGNAKVTDFGLAKIVQHDVSLTQTGAVMGTPGFMSPEQATGAAKEVGFESDVYALGATLYCMLTGRPPFQATTFGELLWQIQTHEPVSPRRLNPAVPVDVETVCLKCLEKRPGERYRNMEAVANELRCILANRPIAARPPGVVERLYRWCQRHRGAAASLFIVVASLAAASLLALRTANREAQLRIEEQKQNEVLTRALADLEFEQAVNDIDAGRTQRGLLRFAHGLRRAAEIGDEGLESAIRVQLGALHPDIDPVIVAADLPSEIAAAAWNATGSLAAVATADTIWVVDIPQKLVRVLSDGLPAPVSALAFDKDDFVIAAGPNGEVKAHPLTGNLTTWEIRDHPQPIVAMQCIDDSLVTLTDDWTLRIWDMRTRTQQGAPLRVEAPAYEFSVGVRAPKMTWRGDWWVYMFNHERLELKSTSYVFHNVPRGYDPVTGEKRDDLALESGEILLIGACVDERGSFVMTRAADGSVQLWQLPSQPGSDFVSIIKPFVRPLFHPREGTAMRRFSSRRAVGIHDLAVQRDPRGRVALVDVSSSRRLSAPLNAIDRPLLAVPSPDGNCLLASNASGELRVLRLPGALAGDPERIFLWLHAVTGMELRDKPIDPHLIPVAKYNSMGRSRGIPSDDPYLARLDLGLEVAIEERLKQLGGPLPREMAEN